MATEPTPPILQTYATRNGQPVRRWWTTWYDAHGKRRGKSLGREDDTTRKHAYARWDNLKIRLKMRPDLHTPAGEEATYTLTRLAAQYLAYARHAFRKDGKPTSHVWNIRLAMRALRDSHGMESAVSFDAPKLAKLRDTMVFSETRCRSMKTVNGRLTIIVQAFAYARERGKIPAHVLADLQTVSRLRKGRTPAKPSKKVRPVHESLVEATQAHLPQVVRDMLTILSLTGIRPEEVCSMRGSEIEITPGRDVWLYRPRHKLEHLESSGEVIRFLGPRAQAVLAPYLQRKLGAYLFSPADATRERLAAKRAASKHNSPSHFARLKGNPVGHLRDHYTTETLRRAVHYACKRAGINKWNPNQIRHLVGTQLRAKYGLESASVQLGHKHLSTTEIYAEQNAQKAMQLAREVG